MPITYAIPNAVMKFIPANVKNSENTIHASNAIKNDLFIVIPPIPLMFLVKNLREETSLVPIE